MQTISLEDEIKLTDGILYHIDFYQDFSVICMNGRPIENISVSDIIESILNHETEIITCAVCDETPSWESYQSKQKIWEAVDKFSKEERDREKKWKKDRKNRHKRAKRFWKEVDKW